MRLLVLAGLVVLSGCAPSLIAGNERGGRISSNNFAKARAFELADAHCHKFGRVARMAGEVNPGDILFDCVSP